MSSVNDPWSVSTITPDFLGALRLRRFLQARQIVSILRDELQDRRVLDYGCGQGEFVRLLLQQGFDAYGCDISNLYVESSALGERFMQIVEPWSMPTGLNYSVISMFDVLEHARHPDEVVRRLRQSSAELAIIKVPMLNGPIGMTARILAKAKSTALLERLLLVGEVAPHYSFYTSAGLIQLFKAQRFELKRAFRIADVGQELPARMRGGDRKSRPIMANILRLAGGILSVCAPVWSDTRVFVFQKEPV